MSDSHKHYLRDLGYLLKEKALRAKSDANVAASGSDADFAAGRALAYFEVITTMRNQAAVFGVSLAEVALDDIDPDRDLA